MLSLQTCSYFLFFSLLHARKIIVCFSYSEINKGSLELSYTLWLTISTVGTD